MAAEAIGAVRIDFTANMATFQRSLKEADKELKVLHTQMKRLSEQAARSFDQMTKGAQAFERVGKDLAKNVTLPLAAFAAAAIKAADPAGKFTERLKDMGVEALVTLQPIGNALIAAFDAFEPTLRRAISAVGVLAEKFGALSPETQRMIIIAGAAAAAIGPLIIAGAGAAKVIGIATAAMGNLLSVAKAFTFVVSPPMLVAIAAIGSAIVGLELGTYVYDEFKVVQMTAAAAISLVQEQFINLKVGWQVAVAAIREAWDSTADFIVERSADILENSASALAFLGLLSDEESRLADTAVTRMRGAYGNYSFDSEYKRIAEQAARDVKDARAVYQDTVEIIEQDFAGKDRRSGRSFDEFMADDFGALINKVGESIQPLRDQFNAFLGDVDAYAAGSEERAAAWRRDAAGAKDLTKASEEANKSLERMRDEAMRIRFEVYPEEKLQADIARIHELAAAVPEILDGPTVQAAIDKLTASFDLGVAKVARKIDTWRDKFRNMFNDFGRDASRTFADFATGADVAFDQVLLSWTRMAIEMAAQQWVFGPAFTAIGTSLFGPATAATPVALPASAGPVALPATMAATSPSDHMRRSLGSDGPGAGGWGGSAPTVQIFDQRRGGQAVQTSESRGPDGERLLRVLIRDEVGQMAGDGGMDRVLGPTYGTRRRPRSR